MELMSNISKAATVSPDALDSEGVWDSALFVRGQFQFHWTLSQHQPLAQFAKVFEGERGSGLADDAASGGVYRVRSISNFELNPTAEQWSMANEGGAMSLQPGDVILKRVAPLVAAVIPTGLPLLSVDGNCFVIRGLSESQAWWTAFALNHPVFADYLLSKSGRGVLSRVTLSVLRNWTPPEIPVEFSLLSRRLAELLQKRTFLAGRIAAIESEVETVVTEQMATTAYEDTEKLFGEKSWWFFFPAVITNTSWLPVHVASDYRAELLHRDADWQPLMANLMPEPPPRNRFAKIQDRIQVLRLSDVSSIPLVPASVEATVPAQATRVFRDPVQQDEVLLSTLASSPRVAFAPFSLEKPVYPVDHWERLRFRSYAAAFALILQTGAVTRQLSALASGSVQQFIRAEDIRRLFLPVISEGTLAHWDRSFRSLAKSWHQTDLEWKASLNEGWQAFYQTYNLPPSQSAIRNR